MNNFFKRLKIALKIANNEQVILYMIEPHRVLNDGTIDASTEIYLGGEIHPVFLEHAFNDCLKSFDDALENIIDEAESDLLIKRVLLETLINKPIINKPIK